jgi:chromate reductase
MKILGISGSLREASFNTALLKTAKLFLRDDIQFEIISIGNIPQYNEDIGEANIPKEAILLIEAIESANAILFSTPEYNHCIPGVLKNAIDWASRPAFDSSLKFKPCGILTASKSSVGGARAQVSLKNILSSTLSPVYPSIEYLLPNAHEMFNTKAELTNQTAQRRLERYINGFVAWAKGQTQ